MLAFGAGMLEEFAPRRRGEEQVGAPWRGCRAARPPVPAAVTRPPSTRIACACAAPCGREISCSRAAAPIEGSASPRKPSVVMRTRSASSSLDVQCRCTASASSPGAMPLPSSTTSMRSMPPPSQRDRDPRGAGVERVLDQLLDRGGRPLDHLAGGDAIHQRLRQEANWRHQPPGYRLRQYQASAPRLGPCAWTPRRARGRP